VIVINGMEATALLDANLACGRGNHTAVITATQRLTYAEIAAHVTATATSLMSAGVVAGEKVVVAVPDTWIFPVVFFACLRLGAIPVMFDPTVGIERAAQALDDLCAPMAIVEGIDARALDAARQSRLRRDSLEVHSQSTNRAFPSSHGSVPAALRTDPDDEELAFGAYSSGATGNPKAVLHRYRTLRVSHSLFANSIFPMRSSDVVLSTSHVFHTYRILTGLVLPFAVGAAAVFIPPAGTASDVAETTTRTKPTILFSVPRLFDTLLSRLDPSDAATLAHCLSASSPLPAVVARAWYERFGIEIVDATGSTELFNFYLVNRETRRLPGSSGVALRGYDVELRGRGQLVVRGPTTFAAYAGDADLTKRTLQDGWVHTGDRYHRDEHGTYWFEGRISDIFKVSGLWVVPEPVEARLLEHDAVREAAVVPVRVDGMVRVRAVVVSPDQSERLKRELRGFCARTLPLHSVPFVVDFAPELPRTPTGKLRRTLLRDPIAMPDQELRT
jgi:acyl-coenzyme A synthetase/AMP-(fatty) acid ligase